MPKARVIKFDKHGDPSVLEPHEVYVPDPPKGHVRINVKAAGLNRAEINFRSGATVSPRFPSTIGYEAAGLIDAVGEEVEGFECGDRVAVLPGLDMEAYGTYAELLNYPADMVVKMPAGQSFVEAAATWMQYLTAYALIDPAGVQAGDDVLITAASSSVGTAAIQIARATGAVPIALTSRREKVETLRRHGASHVFVTSDKDWTEAVVRQCSGLGPRVVFDAVGEKLTPALIDVIGPGGVLVNYGILSGSTMPIAASVAIRKELTLYFYTTRRVFREPERKRQAIAFIFDGIQSGHLAPVIDRTFPFADVAQAHRYLEGGSGLGKVVLTLP
ncbi:MAG: zinc-dependent alcohol dehydrogenase family protein [Novosphingobium sp.]